ncbi:MAG: serine hydrolase [Paracoccaceae bacterium]
MRKLLSRALRLLAVLIVVIAAVAVWKRDEVARLWAVLHLFDDNRIVHNFSHMDEAFLTRPVARGDGAVMPLPIGNAATLPDSVGPWIVNRVITGLVVLKDGKIVHEGYYHGTDATDRRISWSVAKSLLSALFGIVMAEGAIDSLDDPVTKYAPLLVGSAYEGTTIRQVLNMASGVTFDEDYMAFNSDINKMGRVLALGGSMDDFAAGLKLRDREPGQAWHYVSIDTHVIGMVIRGATGRDVAELMSEKLIIPLGLETEPLYVTDGLGEAFVLGGLNMTTRDYARFGQLFLQNGIANGQQIVPANWVAASTARSAPTGSDGMGYGFQWWIPPGAGVGEFMAQGIYGQFIYINRPAGVVIAVNAADRRFTEEGVEGRNIAIYRAIANSL